MDADQRPLPHTLASITADLRAIGLSEGDTVIVHTSLKKVGFVVSGPKAVVEALMSVVTESGTVIMPAFTTDYTDPLDWRYKPPPRDWAEFVRSNLLPFDPATTPSHEAGAVAELFRTYPTVLRNDHPIVSYAAWGRDAEFAVTGAELGMMDGETSPLARIYDLDGKVLLLGVGYGACTSIHLATRRQTDPPIMPRSIPTWDESGQVHWNTYPDVLQPGDLDQPVIEQRKLRFSDVGTAFEGTGAVTFGQVGNAETRLFRQRALVDFTTEYFNSHPYGDAADLDQVRS